MTYLPRTIIDPATVARMTAAEFSEKIKELSILSQNRPFWKKESDELGKVVVTDEGGLEFFFEKGDRITAEEMESLFTWLRAVTGRRY